MSDTERTQAQAGRRAALVIAGTAILWVAASYLGDKLELSPSTRIALDLMALGGFLWAFWMIYNIWRARRDNQGR
ncbi:DUF5337 domain-containing protein [Roseovarius sp. Pro17]|uniref:DUF5337 domain-containing protein n=1 Tax=Roseovarius sp. Pro17 TaxID=3108175 RepID=UPI002D76F3C4|nr:DUF5337 domain-containing protein [Roseovarius sp. Pro17]